MTIRLVLVLTLLATPSSLTEGQPRLKMPRIGVFNTGAPSASQYLVDAFRQGLSEHGYVERQNIIIEYRWGEGNPERLPELAADLVRLGVEVILAGGGDVGVRAAKKATDKIPIVMASSADPVRSGHVTSFARPGGNITGIARMLAELSTKRLEVLRQSLLGVSRVAVLRDPVTEPLILKDMERAAKSMSVQLQVVEARASEDFQHSFEMATRMRVEALILLPSAMFHAHRKLLLDLAAKKGLPAMYSDRVFVEEGGLMSFGTNLAQDYRRAAYFVDKILRGSAPKDLPLERPIRAEFVINLRAAKEIGLTLPPEVLQQADKVIR